MARLSQTHRRNAQKLPEDPQEPRRSLHVRYVARALDDLDARPGQAPGQLPSDARELPVEGAGDEHDRHRERFEAIAEPWLDASAHAPQARGEPGGRARQALAPELTSHPRRSGRE